MLSDDTFVLLDQISSKKAKVCVVGLGYVGVPLVVASAQAGFGVIGVDVDKEKISMINKGYLLCRRCLQRAASA